MAIVGGLLSRRCLMLIKAETVYGTDPTPAGTDAVMVEDLKRSIITTPRTRESLNANMIDSPAIAGAIYAGRDFNIPIAGGASVGVAPEWGAALIACGCTETIVAVTSTTYTPNPAYALGATIYDELDGIREELNGVVGNAVLTLQPGKPADLAFSMKGLFVNPVDQAISTPTFDGTHPPAVMGGTATWGGDALIFRKLSLDLGSVVAERESLSATTGYQGFKIAGRSPKGSFTAEFDKVANHNFYNKYTTNTSHAASFIWGSAGNRFTLTLPVCRITGFSRSSDKGIEVVDVSFTCHDSTGNDSWSLKVD